MSDTIVTVGQVSARVRAGSWCWCPWCGSPGCLESASHGTLTCDRCGEIARQGAPPLPELPLWLLAAREGASEAIGLPRAHEVRGTIKTWPRGRIGNEVLAATDPLSFGVPDDAAATLAVLAAAREEAARRLDEALRAA